MGLKKLYSIEVSSKNTIKVIPSNYLLSLPPNKQIGILTNHLKNLKEAIKKKDPSGPSQNDSQGPSGGYLKLDRTELEMNVKITEDLILQLQNKTLDI